eukprot:SAG31_NODE_4800_length_2952_cov_1.211707_2_plen_62_part_00
MRDGRSRDASPYPAAADDGSAAEKQPAASGSEPGRLHVGPDLTRAVWSTKFIYLLIRIGIY